MITIAINGLGRIGRNFLRAIWHNGQPSEFLNIAAINIGPSDRQLIAHLVQYDSIMGQFPVPVSQEGDYLIIGDHKIILLAEEDPLKLPWKKLGIEWVVECSGHFTQASQARKHIQAGARYVLISAPAQGEDITVILGVNQEMYNPDQHAIVSLGSCTTNALVPVVHVLHNAFGIERGYMTTTHAYTNSQVLLDANNGDPRRSRAAAINMIPTTTGANEMIDRVLPTLAGKIKGHSIRVPVPTVSLIDFVFVTNKEITVEAIHAHFEAASRQSMKGIMAITNKPLVSTDFAGSSYSVTIDTLLTMAQGHMGKVLGWYDNEWAYAHRLKDFLLLNRNS